MASPPGSQLPSCQRLAEPDLNVADALGVLARLGAVDHDPRVHCGAPIAMDKDAASRILAELELHGSTQSGHPTIKYAHPGERVSQISLRLSK